MIHNSLYDTQQTTGRSVKYRIAQHYNPQHMTRNANSWHDIQQLARYITAGMIHNCWQETPTAGNIFNNWQDAQQMTRYTTVSKIYRRWQDT